MRLRRREGERESASEELQGWRGGRGCGESTAVMECWWTGGSRQLNSREGGQRQSRRGDDGCAGCGARESPGQSQWSAVTGEGLKDLDKRWGGD